MTFWIYPDLSQAVPSGMIVRIQMTEIIEASTQAIKGQLAGRPELVLHFRELYKRLSENFSFPKNPQQLSLFSQKKN
jgi:hypothetical protein